MAYTDYALLPIDVMARRDMRPIDKIILCAISYHAYPAAGCQVTINSLCKTAGCTAPTAISAIRHLEKAALIYVDRSALHHSYVLVDLVE